MPCSCCQEESQLITADRVYDRCGPENTKCRNLCRIRAGSQRLGRFRVLKASPNHYNVTKPGNAGITAYKEDQAESCHSVREGRARDRGSLRRRPFPHRQLGPAGRRWAYLRQVTGTAWQASDGAGRDPTAIPPPCRHRSTYGGSQVMQWRLLLIVSVP